MCEKKHEKIEKPKHIIKVIEEFCFPLFVHPLPILSGAHSVWPLMMKLSPLCVEIYGSILFLTVYPCLHLLAVFACAHREKLRTLNN